VSMSVPSPARVLPTGLIVPQRIHAGSMAASPF
jgi:hypothetical protein